MQKELRKTGNDVIGSVPWATHFCQFYQTKQDLLDILVPYFKAGLESNEFCMWITAEPLGVEGAKEAMARALPDFDRYLAKGQIEIMPHTDWYLKGGAFESQRVLNGWVDKLEQALASGYAGLRLTGNTLWLEKKDWKSFADYEAAINSVIGKYNMLALCTYCLDRCSAIEIIDVIRNHEFALIKREGKWELIESSIYKQTKEALEASETRLAHLASFPELNPMPVIELDMAGNIRYMNPATKRLFPDMSAMGSEHPFLANWEALSNTLRSEEPQSLTREINIGGSCYEQSVTYVPLTQSLIFRGLDITERKQTEEQLKQRTLELEAANKELESFSYSVSHDLRAPLRSMDGFSQALLEDYSDKLDDEGRDYLKRIQDSAGNMAQLIDDMLELSRLTRVSMRLGTVNLSELAESIAAELKKAQPKRHVEVSIAPGLVAYGDAKLLRVVLENLLDNAWKFTAKIPHARIEGGITEHDGREVYFVRDNGAGFDMAYADKLFVPFQRLHRTTEFPGTGVGLATVKRLIHRHGGEVWAEGEVGKGATFYFTLP
jgi:signal transduction histidine kinase